MSVLPPGSIIGIIGGGQLGRMTALAAANLGYKTHIYCPEEDCPASHVAYRTTVASYSDKVRLEAFARAVDVITFEFENIPHASVALLSELAIVRPNWKVLHVAQNRLREKAFAAECGALTAAYLPVDSYASLIAAVEKLGMPSILKTAELGYDGKGQYVIRTKEDVEKIGNDVFSHPQAAPLILEAFVNYTKEISVILARSATGEAVCFSPAENRHVNGILDTSTIPADIDAILAGEAQTITCKIAEKLDLVGMLAVEFFITKEGKLLVNEMAPRPHNSGHWSMDACVTSQFEQFVRAVCGLPLGSVALHSRAVMTNLIGSDVNAWPAWIGEPNSKLHIYGKDTVKEGRKMGHVTRVSRLISGE